MARAKDGVSQLPPVLLHVKAKKAPCWKERFAISGLGLKVYCMYI